MRQIRDILEKTISLFRKIFDFLSFITFWVAHQVTGIRVGEIETRAIGHFSAPIEIYLSELDVGVIPKGKRDVWFNNAFVANRALLSKWKRYLRVGPRWYLSSVFRYCSEHPHFASLKVTEYRHWNDEAEWQVYDKHRVLPAAQHHCQFSEAEVAACEKSLKLLGIENNFICVLVRDTAYRGELQPTHRDADIETLIPALADLSKQGVQSVRMGAKVSHSINTTEPGIINYAGSPYWSEILDLYLISKCMFMISTGSGLDSVGTMFRKPLCMVNISELYSWRFYQP